MNKKNVLIFSKYGNRSASTRHRFTQYVLYLKHEFSCIEIQPLLSDRYFQKKVLENQLPLLTLLRDIGQRIVRVVLAKKSDVIVIHIELIPYFPPLFEWLLKLKGCKYVVDLDDALFHQYDHHHNALVRFFLGKKIATVMRLSDHVVAGNRYIADYAIKEKVKKISIIPTVIDLQHFKNSDEYIKNDVFTIAWIGSPSTSPFLLEIIPALQALSLKYNIQISLIGADDLDIPDVDVERFAWEEDREVEYISRCHVGIMPLPDTPWTRGKCGFKLIQYMACGLPVIASPVGVNTDIVDSNNGFLASTVEEWIVALTFLYENPGVCQKMGISGKMKVETQYCSASTKDALIDVLKSTT